MTGTTLNAFEFAPRAVLEHIGHQLWMSAPLWTHNQSVSQGPPIGAYDVITAPNGLLSAAAISGDTVHVD
jgi:hypothetical protein